MIDKFENHLVLTIDLGFEANIAATISYFSHLNMRGLLLEFIFSFIVSLMYLVAVNQSTIHANVLRHA